MTLTTGNLLARQTSACVAQLALLGVVVCAGASAQELFAPPAERQQVDVAKAAGSIAVDGRLDEPAWQRPPQIDGFVQKDPDQGVPSNYRTTVTLVYDDEALYIAAICYQPRNTLRIQNLERDFSFDENDVFGIAIDGFLDERSAVAFQVTPGGNQRDLEIIDSDNLNTDWDALWDVETVIEDDRWVVEMAIPWRTLRYPNGMQSLGFLFTRNIRHVNERTAYPAIPRVFSAYRMAYQGELADLQAPPPSANVRINPYVLTNYFDNESDETNVEAGGEVKWAITPSTVLDITVNTDFAQAEVDRQVVNLDRFSVFFPERRQFFLENATLFDASVTNWIRPFFSRRIGLDRLGKPIPLDGGLRLTSRSSKQEFGLLAMSQQEAGLDPAALFGVARYSRNLGEQSRLGGMLTWRRDDDYATGAAELPRKDNVTYTLDGLWRPNQSVGVQAMLSVSDDDIAGSGVGGQLWAFYENNWLYAGLLEYYNNDYEPGVGLEIYDTNYVMHSPAVNFDLRPEWLPDAIRSFNPGVSAYVFESSDDGDLLFAYAPIEPVGLTFQNGAEIGFEIEPNWQRLDEPFFPAGIEVAPGDYDYTRYRLSWSSDQSAQLAIDLNVETGDYFDGELTSYVAAARYAPRPELELVAELEVNQFRDLGTGQVDDDSHVLGVQLRIAPSPQLQISVLYQHNSLLDRDDWNARLSWEYRPLSYVYLVYNRNETPRDSPAADTEQVILKLTYLFEV